MQVCASEFFRQKFGPKERLVNRMNTKYSSNVNNVHKTSNINPIGHGQSSKHQKKYSTSPSDPKNYLFGAKKSKPNRRLRKNKIAKKYVGNEKIRETLKLFSCNSSGLKNKLLSLEKVINELEVGVFCLQETHSIKEGSIKFENSLNYQIYEQVRDNKSGGGLSVGVLKSLNPVWLRDGGGEVEAMTVQIETKNLKIRITNAYGPQEYDESSKKDKFWAYLDHEILQCQQEGSACIIMTDGNAWLGESIIKQDPHSQNKNGQLFSEFLERNPHLNLMNASDLCDGAITRCRTANGRLEKSIIDFVIVCNQVLPYVQKFVIDEEKAFSLTNYSKKKKIVNSDHNSLILYLKIDKLKQRQERKIIFNYKDAASMQKYKKKTSLINFSSILRGTGPLEVRAKKWAKKLKETIHQCFEKIRLRKKSYKKCNIFKKKIYVIKHKQNSAINKCNEELSNEQAKINFEKLNQNLSTLKVSKNKQQSIWKIKNKFLPKNRPTPPVAKKNIDGQIITNHKELKNVYKEHFSFRMRSRPIHKNLLNYKSNIECEFQKILQSTKTLAVPDWSMQDLDRVLKSLKPNQSQDTMGLINELFMIKNIGHRLKESILVLCNEIKNNLFIPEFMKNIFITAIPKKRKSPLDLTNERFIFLVPKLRGILIKLIYNSIITLIEENLSPSNLGARRGKSPRDHLFVLYAVMNETLRSEHGETDLVFYDITQCYDSLWVQKTLCDLYSNGIKDSFLNLINELTKESSIVVKTPVGTSEKTTIENTIMQGETLSSIVCTSSVDKIGKECDLKPFEYRKTPMIPQMSFVDDILDIKKCGIETKAMNEYTTKQVNLNKLQLSEDKCARIHLQSKNDKPKECEELKIDLWNVEKLKDGSGKTYLEDKYKGKAPVKTVSTYTYLGDKVHFTGSNKFTINDRVSKAKGFSRDIKQVLEGTFFGEHHFEAFKVLRNSMLYSVLTYNLEIAYNLSKTDIRDLDKVDLSLMRNVLMTSSKVSRCLILLELGFLSVEYVIKQKRLNYLYNLIQMEDKFIAKQVFIKQSQSAIKGDWIKYIHEDMKELQIEHSFEEISKFSKRQWKQIVKDASQKACFKSLLSDKSKLSKGKEIKYDKFVMQPYLKSGGNITSEVKRKIFTIRTRDLNIRGNFKNSYNDIKCQVPECDEQETQKHVFQSYCIHTSTIHDPNVSIKYEEIFGENVSSQSYVANVIYRNIERRNNIIPSAGGPEEPRRRGGRKNKAAASPSLVIRKARPRKNKGQQS